MCIGRPTMSTASLSSGRRPLKQHLFDDKAELFEGPADHTESTFHFLNRAAGPTWDKVRSLTESWYEKHPDENELRARFREHAITQHAGAWWELYVFTLFSKLGYAIELHPTIDGRGHPDLLAVRGRERVYIECVVIYGEDHGGREQAWITECIDAVRHPDFMADVEIISRGSQRPKRAQVIRAIENWLLSLDYDVVLSMGWNDLPSQTFEVRGWTFKITALPVDPDRRQDGRRFIAVGPVRGAYPTSTIEDFRETLGGKAYQCRGVDAPLIVAVLNWSSFAGLDDVEKAVFGSTAIRYNLGDSNSVRGVRLSDGYWHPGPPRLKGASVSAVMFSEHLRPWRVAQELPTVWTNPWAKSPLTSTLPLATQTAENNGRVYWSASQETSPPELFGIAADWPGFAE